jgi:hypothetical protein
MVTTTLHISADILQRLLNTGTFIRSEHYYRDR